MKFLSRLKLVAVAAAFAGLAAAPLPALADGASISTPAWTNHALPFYFGPGQSYGIKTWLPGGQRLYVDRCSGLWCMAHTRGTYGYAFLYSLSFGQGPNSWWWPFYPKHTVYRTW